RKFPRPDEPQPRPRALAIATGPARVEVRLADRRTEHRDPLARTQRALAVPHEVDAPPVLGHQVVALEQGELPGGGVERGQGPRLVIEGDRESRAGRIDRGMHAFVLDDERDGPLLADPALPTRDADDLEPVVDAR